MGLSTRFLSSRASILPTGGSHASWRARSASTRGRGRNRQWRRLARLAADYQDAEKIHIESSPTFVPNEGRQKLFGNVDFRIVEANIREVLREPNMDQASWC